MQEFELLIDNEVLRKGLRQSDSRNVNDLSLTDLYNLQCRMEGLIPYEDLEVWHEDANWPFDLGIQAWCMEQTSDMYLFDWSPGGTLRILDQDSTELFVSSIPVANEMENYPAVVDMGNYIAFVSPGWGIIHGTIRGTLGHGLIQDLCGDSNMPIANTACLYNGRIIFGGIKEFCTWYNCNESYVVWSRVGSTNCHPDERNGAGYTVCPNIGRILRCLPIHDQLGTEVGVMFYGTSGVYFLYPSTGRHARFATFGRQAVSGVGLASKGAVAGNRDRHVGVTSTGEVFITTADGLERIGYRQQIAKLTLEDIIVSFDQVNDQFFISDGVRTLLLTNWGMSEVYQHVKGALDVDGVAYVVVGSEGSEDLRIQPGVFDMQQRGMKSVGFVETDLHGATIDRLYKREDDNLVSSGPVACNSFGVSYKLITAQEFALRLTRPDFRDAYITYIKARWKMGDKRWIRGQTNV